MHSSMAVTKMCQKALKESNCNDSSPGLIVKEPVAFPRGYLRTQSKT